MATVVSGSAIGRRLNDAPRGWVMVEMLRNSLIRGIPMEGASWGTALDTGEGDE